MIRYVYTDDISGVFYSTYNFVADDVPPTDTCSCPGSGDWIINCADNCVLSTTCNLGGNNFYASGSGTFIVSGVLSNYVKGKVFGGCKFKIINGGKVLP